MRRFFDILLSFIGMTLLFPVYLFLYVALLFDTRLPIFKQVRVGRHQKPFMFYKFRSLRPDVESIPSHLIDPVKITPLGKIIRRTKLDELPQLWNVFKGDMSLVGPRPCLPTQSELIQERFERQVYEHRPGITGLAQIKGVDMSTPRLLAKTDALMLKSLNLKKYVLYILATFMGKGRGDAIFSKLNK